MSRDVTLYIAEILDNMGKAIQAVSGLKYDDFADNWEKAYCDWIIEAAIVYHKDIINNITIDGLFTADSIFEEPLKLTFPSISTETEGVF